MLIHANESSRAPSRTVVIGAHGFVGGAIVEALLRDSASVIGLTRADVDLLAENAASELSARLKPGDAVVFVSALAPARNTGLMMANLRMAEAVIAATAKVAIAHLVYISSDAVYADDVNPVTERSICQPSSLHGMMHAARELMLKSEIKVPVAILRPSLLYGAKDPHNGYGPNRFRRLAEAGQAIKLFGNGEEKRDHVFIDDVARLVSLVLFRRSAGILNIATGVSTSFRETAELASAGQPVEIIPSPRQNPITHRHFDIAGCLKAFPDFRYTLLRDGLARAAAHN